MKYQVNYSSRFPESRDLPTRRRKAAKILQILKDFLHREDLSGLDCLDLGCSVGVISDALACAGGATIGLDIDSEALEQAPRHSENTPVFVVGDVGATPFPERTFDIIICSQVYEHAPDLELLVQEIERLLKKGGVCFFSGPNRWALLEEHYDLPFLSWLPKKWADRFIRATGRAIEYYEHPLSGNQLRKVLRGFGILDLTPDLLKYPEHYSMDPEVGAFKYFARFIPSWGWGLVGHLVPNFNWLLVKAEK